VAIFNCPSRRRGGPYPNTPMYSYLIVDGTGATRTIVPQSLARTDYGGNCGTPNTNEIDGGPSTAAQGDNPTYNWGNTNQYDGILFRRSQVKIAQITRGTSNVYLVGEKYINPTNYFTGNDPGDNEAMYVGFDNDVFRCAFNLAMRDDPTKTDTLRFGSVHPGSFNMLFCDGTVRQIDYAMDPAVYTIGARRME
jgi:prepilin-type processing-associated H-X9-DG protein